MYFANININEIPEIGFAHRHTSFEYAAKYGRSDRMCIEIVYISSGTVEIELYGEKMYAQEGSVMVLFRHLPIHTHTVKKGLNSHCAVLGEFSEYRCTLVNETDFFSHSGFLVPFVIEPCAECSEIGKRLYKIASDMEKDREKNGLSSSVEFLSILKKLDEIHRSKSYHTSPAYSEIAAKVCAYCEDNIDEDIRLSDIAHFVGKSPNHISCAFKAEMGMTISHYINLSKTKRIAYLMQNEEKSFKEACEEVSLCDETYGYKLFKKHIGVTPKEYMSITTKKKSRSRVSLRDV